MTTTTWNGSTADWNTPGDWSGGVPNSSTITADLAGTTSYTLSIAGGEAFTVGTLNLTDANATLSIGGTLTVASTFNLSAGTLVLSGGIVGGAVKLGSGSVAWSDGSLTGTKFEGLLDLSAQSAHLRVYNGITLTGATGTGTGTVNLTGAYSELDFYGTQTVDKATINIGGTSGYDMLDADDATLPAAVLTLGSGLQLVDAGASVYLQGSPDATIVNAGTITAAVSGGSFQVQTVAFTNTGTISIGGGESFIVDAAVFTNTGTIDVAGGAVLHLQGNLLSSGLGTIKTSGGGTVSIDGGAVLDNTGSTLKIGGSDPLGKVTLYGGILGGTIVDAGSGFTFANGGILDGVKYEGTMDLSGSQAHVRIYDGITLTGSTGSGNGAINVTGFYSEIDFYGTQKIDKATITLGGAGFTDEMEAYATGVSGTLTLGTNLTLTSGGPNDYLSGNGTAKIVNDGTIDVTDAAGGSFTINGAYFLNAGTIAVSGGEQLTIDAGTFSDLGGTINVTGGGVLHLEGNLLTGTLGTIKATTGGIVSLDSNAVLNNGGGVLKVGGSNPLGQVTLYGTIVSGTIIDAGSGFIFGNGGNLDGVKYEGTMDLSGSQARARIYDGITLTGVKGTGNGAINVTGFYSEIDFYGSQKIDKATITLGGTGNTDYLEAYMSGTATTLTFGTGLTLTAGGANDYLGGNGTAEILNDGTIDVANPSGGTFTINPYDFANAGTIDVAAGEQLVIDATTFSNTGGTIAVTADAVLHLEGTLLSSALGTITTATGGTVSIDYNGVLSNTGSVFRVGGSNPLGKVTLSGGIVGGTIIDAGSGFTFAIGGVLTGVKYEGTMDLSGSQARVAIYGGITLTGASGTGNGAINVTGFYSEIDFYGTQKIDKATITLGGAGNTDYMESYATGTTTTLTLGTNLTLTSGGPNVYLSGNANAAIVNDGTIDVANAAGGTFTISPAGFANVGTIYAAAGEQLVIDTGSFSNTGTIAVSGSAVLHLEGHLSTAALGTITTATGGTISIDGNGVLDNTGGTLSVGGTNPFGVVTLAGSILSGTIADAGSGFTFADGALDGVTYEGTLSLATASARVGIYEGITLTGSGGTGNGVLNITGTYAEVDFYGTQTIDKAAVTLGSGTNTDYLEAYDTSLVSTLTFGKNLTIATGGANAFIGGGGGAKIVNLGSITAGTGGGTLTIDPSAKFTNAGSMLVNSGGTLTVQTAFANTGTLEVATGTAHLQYAVSGSGGTLRIDTAGTLDVEAAIGSGQDIVYNGTGGKLQIDTANLFAAGVTGFTKGDTLDLTNIAFGSSTKLSFSGTSTQGTLTVTDGTRTASILLFGQYAAAGFGDATDTHSGTLITYTPPAHSTRPQLAMGH